MNKKAIIFNPILTVLFLFVMIYALFQLGIPTAVSDGLGQSQASLFMQYQGVEKVLFFIDQSAIISAKQTISELASNGGFAKSNIKKCGQDRVWKSDCFPVFEQEFNIDFTLKLDSYLDKIDHLLIKNLIKLPLNNYEISLIQEELLHVVGVAKSPIQSTLQKDSKTISRYQVNPNFNIPLTHSPEDYSILIIGAKELFKDCKATPTKGCVVKNAPPSFELCKDQRPGIFDFCVRSDHKDVEYRFGLVF